MVQLSPGARIVTSVRDSSATAALLCAAAYECDLRLVTAVLDAGVNPDEYAKSTTVSGYTALTAAAGFAPKACDIIDVLLQRGASINLPNHYGRTPLMSAVISGNAATCDRLLQHGAALDVQHKNGMTALDYARKAVTESRTDEDAATATRVLETLLSWQARCRLRRFARHVRVHHVLAQRWRDMLLCLFHEVHFRPDGLGAAACRENFEAVSRIQAEVEAQ